MGPLNMLKPIQSLLLLLLSIPVLDLPVLANPALTEEQKASKVSTEHQTLKLYKGFFPYQSCLLVTINQVVKKPNKVLLKATVEDVYRGNYKKGYPLSFAMNDYGATPALFAFLSALKSTKQIIAFDPAKKNNGSFEDLRRVSANPICNLWVPYAHRGYQSKDITLLKSLIKDSPTEPAQAKAAFQRLLETKWTTNRINDFCRPETQRNWLSPLDNPAVMKPYWVGTLHASKVAELSGKKVNWSAQVSNNAPVLYTINVTSPDPNIAGWDLGLDDIFLEEWTAEDFLKFRVRKSIHQAAFADWCLNHEKHPAATNYMSLFSGKSNESLRKDKSGKVTSYQSHLDNGTTLTAILRTDKQRSIEKLLINGKLDPGWNDMYNKALFNLAKCKDRVTGE
jgi:hypothetical protein